MAEAAKPIDPDVAQDLARLAIDLSHDKKFRGKFGKLVKEAKPDSRHAAAFADVEIEDKFEAFERQQEAKELKRQQDAVLSRMNAQRAALLTGGEDESGPKYSEEDVKKIEVLMQQKGVTDYEDGRVLYAATLPPVNPKPNPDIPKHGSTWEFPEWGKFGADPVRAAREVAHDVISEFQRKRA